MKNLMGASMTRAYIAAGASLFAVGAVVTNPVAPSLPDVQLPTARSVEVNLTAAEEFLESVATKGVADVQRIRDTASTMVAVAQAHAASARHAASSAAAGASAFAKAIAGAVTRTAGAVTNRRTDGAAVAPQQAVASAQAAPTAPELGKILGIAVLPATFAFQVGETASRVTQNIFIAAADISLGLAVQDPAFFTAAQNTLMTNIPAAFHDLAEDFDKDLNAAAAALGLPPFDPNDPTPGQDPVGEDATAVAALKAPSATTAVKPKEATPTKQGEDATASDTDHPVSKPHKGSSASNSTTGTTAKDSTTKDVSTSKNGSTETRATRPGGTTGAGATTTSSKTGGTTKAGGAKAGKAGHHEHTGASSGSKSSGSKAGHHEHASHHKGT
jgi:hypothetical protein